MPFAPTNKSPGTLRTEQRRRLSDERRGSARERGYTARWDTASKVYLANNPLCRWCEAQGRLVPATVTDHIRPHRGDAELFWDTENWQPLCTQCHNKKTAREDGGFGRHREGGCPAKL